MTTERIASHPPKATRLTKRLMKMGSLNAMLAKMTS